METKRTFLIISDLDGTFDTKNSKDIYNFIDNCKQISNEFKVKVKLHFVSGTTVNDLEKLIDEYTKMCPELLPYLGKHIMENGTLTSPLGEFQRKICKDTELYDKAYGIEYIIHHTPVNGEVVVGCCFAGDSYIDRVGFQYLEMIDKYCPLNATPIILNSNASAAANKNVVFERESCLNGVNMGLNQMISIIKTSKVALENIANEEISSKIPRF